MGEDKAFGTVKAEQSFLVLQNQFVGTDVIADIGATFYFTINSLAFLVNTEIAGVCVVNADAAKI